MSQHDDIPSTDSAEIEPLIDRLKRGTLDQQDTQLIERLLRTLLSLIHLLQRKNASISRLKRMIFGPSSDTRAAATPAPPANMEASAAETASSATGKGEGSARSDTPQQRPGHGRRGVAAYTGAPVVRCEDAALRPGDGCPDQLCRGHLYDTHTPAVLIRLEGQPIVGGTRFEQQVLRCSACMQRFTAPLPAGVPPEKFAPSADVAMALAKYSAGLPFHRLSRMQASCGIPLSASVMFARCEAVADAVLPIFLELRRLAATGQVISCDDTRVKILELVKENKQLPESERRGMQTTGIVARVGQYQIALYASGRRHAGENMAELLRARPTGLPPPIQMGDASANNWDHEFVTLVAKCLAHARRQFVEIEEAFPEQCRRVLDDLAAVYATDAEARELTPEERLRHHQRQSGPVMKKLGEWLSEQLSGGGVEPNGTAYKALSYLRRHWEGLTLFLRESGAPLDSNVVERALKLAVLQRKNAMFYKTVHGASVGDLLMSIIESCRLNQVSAWEYLLALVQNARLVRQDPGAWLPWNFPSHDREQRAA